jgi:hypothetical protein
MTIQTDYGRRTINEMVLLFQHGQINLQPGFQRKSVWSDMDRRRLVQSIVSEYPLPNIFLYRRSSRGKTVYDVIDGKQRLETILMFMGIGRFKRDRFEAKLDLDADGLRWWDWKAIRRHVPDTRHRFECYPLQTVEVSGDLSEIVDLFVRINSTGKRLTSGEKRHARFYDCRFLKEAERLVRKQEKYLRQQRILSPAQLDRMKGTELFCELLMSIHQGGLINKKTSLDRAMGNDSVNGNTLARVMREFTSTIGLVRRMFTELKVTRFHNTAEFYSLFMLIWEMNQQKLVLTDRKSNRLAFELLKRLSTGVDELREQYRHARPVKPQPPFSDYLLTVQGDTDSAATRQRRVNIIRALLQPLYEYKDGRRIFSQEQRRIIWNNDNAQKCVVCRRKLSWEDFTVDHMVAYIKGGKTRPDNAQLMCRSCNSRKGGK